MSAAPTRVAKKVWKRTSLAHVHWHATAPAGDAGTKSLPTEATEVKLVAQKFSDLVSRMRYRMGPKPSALSHSRWESSSEGLVFLSTRWYSPLGTLMESLICSVGEGAENSSQMGTLGESAGAIQLITLLEGPTVGHVPYPPCGRPRRL